MKYLKMFENFLILEDNHQLIQDLNKEGKVKSLNGIEFYVYPKNVLKGSDTDQLSGSRFKVKIIDAGEIEAGASNLLTIHPKCEVSDIQLGENEEENEYLQGPYGMIKNFNGESSMSWYMMFRDSYGKGIDYLNCDYPGSSSYVIESDNKLIPALNDIFNTKFDVKEFPSTSEAYGTQKFVYIGAYPGQ